MGTMASQITSLTIVYSTVYSGADQRKHQSSASLAFVRGIHRSPVNSPRKWPVTRKMFPFDDVITKTWSEQWPKPSKSDIGNRSSYFDYVLEVSLRLMLNEAWWHHQMETFFALLTVCVGNLLVTGEFPSQRPVTRSFDIVFDLHLKNGWVNNRDASDLRRHRAYHDVTVMKTSETTTYITCYHAWLLVLCWSMTSVSWSFTVLKIRTICHARDLWKLARSCKELRLPCPPDPYNLLRIALLNGF